MSAAKHTPEVGECCASVTAHFTLHSERGEDVASAAAELIRRLQETANLPQCAYELDVDVSWCRQERALAPGGAGAPPGAESSSGSR
jgi:hypothetical protein